LEDMGEPSSQPARYCRRCGCLLSRDHTDAEWCSPCLKANRHYDPAEDPFFLFKLIACLAERAPERVEPLKALGIHPEYRIVVKDAVRSLRRQGFIITATERTPGYHYIGHVRITQREVSPHGVPVGA
jgi:hypothetical protein